MANLLPIEIIDELKNDIGPINLIKLMFLSNGIINEMCIRRVSSMIKPTQIEIGEIKCEREKFDGIVAKLVRIFNNLNFEFRYSGVVIIYTKKKIPLSVLSFINKYATNRMFHLRCSVYINKLSDNKTDENLFYRESLSVNFEDEFNQSCFETEFQNKFIQLLNLINFNYGTDYAFSFEFVKTYVRKVISKIQKTTQENTQILYTQDENVLNEIKSLGNKSKKRRITEVIYEDSDSDSSFESE